MNENKDYKNLLESLIEGQNLTRDQAHGAFGWIMDGLLTPAQISALLVAMAAKGHAAPEITGAASAMRDHVSPVNSGGLDVVDTCGTGGTGISTFNVSTAAALVAAGAGAVVAKHGNRTNTRASGSADVLAALGVNIKADNAVAARCLQEAGVCFCFAVTCHPAMKYAAPVRKELGVRTIFNLLGPLTNPAGAKRQLLGLFDAALTETIAEVLGQLGTTHAMVVHADDGLDEISTTSATKISELRGGKISTYTVRPGDFGFGLAQLDQLYVSSPQESAEVIKDVLDGKHGPARDMVILNAAAALTVAGKAADIGAAVPLAAESVDSGAAKKTLEKLIATSNTA